MKNKLINKQKHEVGRERKDEQSEFDKNLIMSITQDLNFRICESF